MSTSLFVSYHYDTDRRYKNLLQAWDANDLFDFNFYDASVDISVASDAAGPIRRVISQRIRESDVFLCLVGEKTYKSAWVEWEIDKAVELEKPVVAVKIDNRNQSPAALYGIGATWAKSFTFDNIRRAVNQAYWESEWS